MDKTFFDQLVKNDLTINQNIQKVTKGQKDNYTASCVLYYHYFKECHNMISIHFCKQQGQDITLIQNQ